MLTQGGDDQGGVWAAAYGHKVCINLAPLSSSRLHMICTGINNELSCLQRKLDRLLMPWQSLLYIVTWPHME